MADHEEQGREALAEWFHQSTMECAHRGDVHECVLRARALLASGWLKAHDAEVAAAALREAADAIQAMHPGEVKNSVLFLRARADGGQPTMKGESADE